MVGDAGKIHQRWASAAPAAAGGAAAGAVPAAGSGAGGSRGGIRRRPEVARIVELFYLKGSDYARDMYTVARPWRPYWSPKPRACPEI